jgi:hypothetical protein
MSVKVSLDTLWKSATGSRQTFQLDSLKGLPSPVQHYLEHAIAPNTPLAAAVRLQMHGEIKLKKWLPFRAEQVICWQRGMLWQATVWINGLPIIGSDRVVDGEGAMQWKLLGLLPIVKASGSDVTRSAIGRMQGEYVWLPSALCQRACHNPCYSDIQWSALSQNKATAKLTFLGETTHLTLRLGDTGQLQQAYFQRWGDPDQGTYRYENFGIYVEDEGTFSGYTIPTRIRAGWFFGSPRFESEGEFFRATIDKALYL